MESSPATVLQADAALPRDEAKLELLTIWKRYLDQSSSGRVQVHDAVLFRYSYVVSRDSIPPSESPVFVKPRHDFIRPHTHSATNVVHYSNGEHQRTKVISRACGQIRMEGE
jgi:hypothetical protein